MIALAQGGVDKATALLKLIKKEGTNKRWRRTKNVTGKKRRQSVLSVKVPIIDEEGNTTTKKCVTQQDCFEAAEPVLVDLFSGAFSSPFYSGRLFNNLGFMGDSKCVQQVHEGTQSMFFS